MYIPYQIAKLWQNNIDEVLPRYSDDQCDLKIWKTPEKKGSPDKAYSWYISLQQTCNVTMMCTNLMCSSEFSRNVTVNVFQITADN